jgi:hypothetical protein
MTVYSDSVPAVQDVYASPRYDDSLVCHFVAWNELWIWRLKHVDLSCKVWAGLWMYLATNQTSYFDEAMATWWAAGNMMGSNEVFNWASKVRPYSIPLLACYIKA